MVVQQIFQAQKATLLKFLNNQDLNYRELWEIKNHLIAYISMLPLRPIGYKTRIRNYNQEQLYEYINELLEMGIDPF
jgi:hypothetical protein